MESDLAVRSQPIDDRECLGQTVDASGGDVEARAEVVEVAALPTSSESERDATRERRGDGRELGGDDRGMAQVVIHDERRNREAS